MNNFTWNYAMIKVDQEDDDEIGMIVEIVYSNNGDIQGFSKANLISIEDLNIAYHDISKQNGKLNTYFYDNGSFTHTKTWDGVEFNHSYTWLPHQN